MVHTFQERSEYSILRAKVKGFALEGRSLAKAAQGTSGLDRSVFKQLKKRIGYHMRDYLLAYAFVRGISYKTTEKHCSENNKPDAKAIFKIIKECCPWTYGYKLNESDIVKYLSVEVAEEKAA